MLLVEVQEIINGVIGSINVYGFESLAEFAQFKREKNHPLIKEWYGDNYEENYLSLTYVCRECTEENMLNAQFILENYLDFLKFRNSRY